SPFVVLLWCQLHRLRGLTVAAAAGTVMLSVFALVCSTYERGIDLPELVPQVAEFMIWFWAALLNVGVAMLLFAGELEDGSAAALRERGRMGGAALAAKGAAWGIVNAAYGLYAVLLATAATAAVGGWDYFVVKLGTLTLNDAAPFLLGAACCLLASVTTRSAVGAVGTAAVYFLALTIPVLAVEGNVGFRLWATTLQTWSPASPMATCFLTAAGVVGALAAAVAYRWPEVPWLDDGFWPWAWKRTASPMVAEAPRFDALRRAVDRLFARNAATRRFGVLVWPELRPALGFVVFGLVLLAVDVAAVRFLGRRSNYLVYTAPFLWAVGAGIGLLRAAVVGGGLRVVAERGVSVGSFLAAKTSVWLPVAAVGLVAWLVVYPASLVPEPANPPPTGVVDERYPPIVCAAALYFAVLGQFAVGALLYAMTRRLLIAAGLSLFFFVPQIGWWWTVLAYDVPWWWAAAPIPFVVFAATYVYLAAWMKREGGVGAWRPAGALLAVWAAMVGVGFATAIPAFDVSGVLDAPPSETTADAFETRRQYDDLLKQFRPFHSYLPRDVEWGPKHEESLRR
ncbi:MAG: hypothetical protein ACRDD1_17035, partial [Planctomycetia bacterium]